MCFIVQAIEITKIGDKEFNIILTKVTCLSFSCFDRLCLTVDSKF